MDTELRSGRTFVVPYWRIPDGFVRGKVTSLVHVECTLELSRDGNLVSTTCANAAPITRPSGPAFTRMLACVTPRPATADKRLLEQVRTTLASQGWPTRSAGESMLAVSRRIRTHVEPEPTWSDEPIPLEVARELPDAIKEEVQEPLLASHPYVIAGKHGDLILSETLPQYTDHQDTWRFDTRFEAEPRATGAAVIDDLERKMAAIDPAAEPIEGRLAYHINRALIAAHRGDREGVLGARRGLAAAIVELKREPWTRGIGAQLRFADATLGQLTALETSGAIAFRDPCTSD